MYRDDYCRCCDCDIVVPGRHIGAEIEDDREILFDELICGNLPEEQLNLTGRSAMTCATSLETQQRVFLFPKPQHDDGFAC